MDNASAYGAEDCRFDPYHGRNFLPFQHLIRAADLLVAEALKVDGFDAAKAFEQLTKARRSLALFQHHDAITGWSSIS